MKHQSIDQSTQRITALDEFECIDLRNWMLLTCAASRIALHELGNHEWVLRTMHDGGAWFIWSMDDARAFCQDLEDKGRKNREKVSV